MPLRAEGFAACCGEGCLDRLGTGSVGKEPSLSCRWWKWRETCRFVTG